MSSREAHEGITYYQGVLAQSKCGLLLLAVATALAMAVAVALATATLTAVASADPLEPCPENITTLTRWRRRT